MTPTIAASLSFLTMRKLISSNAAQQSTGIPVDWREQKRGPEEIALRAPQVRYPLTSARSNPSVFSCWSARSPSSVLSRAPARSHPSVFSRGPAHTYTYCARQTVQQGLLLANKRRAAVFCMARYDPWGCSEYRICARANKRRTAVPGARNPYP
jgi:hypothetical protein